MINRLRLFWFIYSRDHRALRAWVLSGDEIAMWSLAYGMKNLTEGNDHLANAYADQFADRAEELGV